MLIADFTHALLCQGIQQCVCGHNVYDSIIGVIILSTSMFTSNFVCIQVYNANLLLGANHSMFKCVYVVNVYDCVNNADITKKWMVTLTEQ